MELDSNTIERILNEYEQQESARLVGKTHKPPYVVGRLQAVVEIRKRLRELVDTCTRKP